MAEPEEGLPCEVCGAAPTIGEPWLLLNRFGVGTGYVRRLSERRNDDGEYLWHLAEREKDERATGVVLHWPVCAIEWIDAYLSETTFDAKQQGMIP